ncbi:MAG: class I SAM-dependent methyltransferase [Polyangiaceae bacterium]
MLLRVLEPEVMDTEEEAADYDAMDHAAVNDAFCTDFIAAMGDSNFGGRVLDVGTGTALIPIALCKKQHAVQVVALDLAKHMLARARSNVESAGVAKRIELVLRDAKKSDFPERSFDAVISNSIVHHIPNPADALASMWSLVANGGLLFVRDLFRPESDDAVRQLVETYAPTGDTRTNRQRALFEASLRAALTPAEVETAATRAGIANASVRVTSDRHWTLTAHRASA